jgi:ABC-type polysaccharide/polyol phosphate transport system ATPase subunit
VKAAKAVVLVTHDMDWVREYCNRAILIEKGRVIVEGPPEEVTALHLERTREETERRKAEHQAKGLDPALQPRKRVKI